MIIYFHYNFLILFLLTNKGDKDPVIEPKIKLDPTMNDIGKFIVVLFNSLTLDLYLLF